MLASSIGFAAVLVLALTGVPLGFSMLLVGSVGFAILRSNMVGEALIGFKAGALHIDWDNLVAGFAMAGQQMFDVSTNYGFTVVPLFILMGAFIHRAELSTELYDAANAMVGHRRGGLAMGTVVACGGFAAVCGSSVATAATMGRVAMPSMRRYGYADSLSTGAIAAGGTLGILIPPSVPMVIYGILAEADVGKLFIAGVLPGIILTLLFVVAVAVRTAINPEIGPPAARIAWPQRFRALGRVWGILFLFGIIIGGIYFGIFTPNEAAGIGAAGAFLFALSRRKLGWRTTFEALIESSITTGMIFIVTIGALVFANFITIAGLTSAMTEWINGLNATPMHIILAICLIYLVLGCVFDSLAMLILTVPVFVAILKPLGVDLIWFGIIVIIVVELGLITPPIGMNVFVVNSVVPDVSVWTIFEGVWPFLIAMIVCLGLIMAFPWLATGLPSLMATQ
ncbi:MAG: TRAP transporter large permease [Beijerinckiaceae bacterium]|jgi:C4-dicarboxylate transporter, DctM subunit|nr:TRAP transporter large permease [Beijerinckiaceae bacterium]